MLVLLCFVRPLVVCTACLLIECSLESTLALVLIQYVGLVLVLGFLNFFEEILSLFQEFESPLWFRNLFIKRLLGFIRHFHKKGMEDILLFEDHVGFILDSL